MTAAIQDTRNGRYLVALGKNFSKWSNSYLDACEFDDRAAAQRTIDRMRQPLTLRAVVIRTWLCECGATVGDLDTPCPACERPRSVSWADDRHPEIGLSARDVAALAELLRVHERLPFVQVAPQLQRVREIVKRIDEALTEPTQTQEPDYDNPNL